MGSLNIYKTEELFKNGGNLSVDDALATKSTWFKITPFKNVFYYKFANYSSCQVIKDFEYFMGINEDPFEYSFSTTWNEGPGFKAGEWINNFIKADKIKITMGKNYIALPINDEWSQKIADESAPLSITLKFKVLNDAITGANIVNTNLSSTDDSKIIAAIKLFSLLSLPPFRFSPNAAVKEITETIGNITNCMSDDYFNKIFDACWNEFVKLRALFDNRVKNKNADDLHNEVKNNINKILNEKMAIGEMSNAYNHYKACFETIINEHKLVLDTYYTEYTYSYTNGDEYLWYEYDKDKKDKKISTRFLKPYDYDELTEMTDFWRNDIKENFKEWLKSPSKKPQIQKEDDKNENGMLGNLLENFKSATETAKDIVGLGANNEQIKNQPRGNFTVSLFTPHFNKEMAEKIDWYIQSFSFIPSIQCGTGNVPLYIDVSLSLETVMSFSNFFIQKLFDTRNNEQ